MSNTKSRVLLYGDSNTFGFDPQYDLDPIKEGYPYPSDLIWTNIVKDELSDRFDIFVDAVSGRTTAYDRLDKTDPEEIFMKNGLKSLVPALEKYAPLDIVEIMLGTNDCNSDMLCSPEKICGGMESLVNCCRETLSSLQDYEPKIIITAPATMKGDIEKSAFFGQLDHTSVEKSIAIVPLYKELANKMGCQFIEESSELEISPIDCEHLTIDAHKKLAKIIKNKLETLL